MNWKGRHSNRCKLFAAGVDNFNSWKYFLFHPFPQRRLVASLRYSI
jgi:hypothetical protein